MSNLNNKDGNSGNLGGFKRTTEAPYVPVDPMVASATEFDPFSALGLTPTATREEVRPAFLRAMRHRHESAIARFPATANAFPSQVQVQNAYDYLLTNGTFRNMAVARSQWIAGHCDVFNPRCDIGSAGVFTGATIMKLLRIGVPNPWAAASTTVSASATSSTSTPASAFTSGTRRPNPYTATPPDRPTKSPRTAASGAGSSPAGSGTPQSSQKGGPIEISSDEDAYEWEDGPFGFTGDSPSDSDDEIDGAPPATPTPKAKAKAAGPTLKPKTRPSGPGSDKIMAQRGSGGAMRTSSPYSSRTTIVVGGTGAAAANRPIRTPHRSGGTSTRNAAIANPITHERITVGEWALAGLGAGNGNAVIAGFDIRGRMFYRITNLNMSGNPVPARTATNIGFDNINFRQPYQNMTHDQVRMAVDAHLRMNPYQRP